MNKTLLLIICDFLLISLLALARFDEQPLDKQLKNETQMVEEAVSVQEDMSDILKASLEEERLARESLSDELTKAQEELKRQQEELARQAREAEASRAELTRQELEKRRLAAERAALERKLIASRTNIAEIKQEYDVTRSKLDLVEKKEAAAKRDKALLEEALERTRTDMSKLKVELADAKSDVAVSQKVLDELQSDLRQQVALSSELQQNMTVLEKEKEVIAAQKQQLSGQLQTARVETRMREEQLVTMKEEVALVRTEKARLQEQTSSLTENVSELAESSEKLTEEIRAQKSQNANAIFLQISTNLINTTFKAERSGLFGNSVEKDAAQQTILITTGERVFAIYHVEDTPYKLDPFPVDWRKFTGTLGRESVLYSITQLLFLDRDPRIVIVPIGGPQAQKLGSRIYPLANDPAKFEEAVLVNPSKGYYGECAFQIDPATPNYVRMQRERFSFFSGRFVPSRGDLVVSKTGEVLGVMANKEYCLLLTDLAARRSIRTGSGSPGRTLVQMYNQVSGLPGRLQ